MKPSFADSYYKAEKSTGLDLLLLANILLPEFAIYIPGLHHPRLPLFYQLLMVLPMSRTQI
jgi:hypothetical protein